VFSNLKKWKNVYKINCYKDGHVKTYILNLWYQEKPVKIIVYTWSIKYNFIYLKDSATEEFVNILKSKLKQDDILQYFNFIWYDKRSKFEWALQSTNYDIVLIWTYLGFKKDIGNIFMFKNPVLNPSRYKNLELKSLYSQYLISSWKTKQILYEQIEKIYNNTLPLVFFWKYLGTYWQRKNLDNVFPKRLYNLALRKQRIEKVVILKKPIIDKDVFSLSKFISWIKNQIWIQ
jgi:hypothetical protein